MTFSDINFIRQMQLINDETNNYSRLALHLAVLSASSPSPSSWLRACIINSSLHIWATVVTAISSTPKFTPPNLSEYKNMQKVLHRPKFQS